MSIILGTSFTKFTAWIVLALLAALMLPLILLYSGRFEDMPHSDPNVGDE